MKDSLSYAFLELIDPVPLLAQAFSLHNEHLTHAATMVYDRFRDAYQNDDRASLRAAYTDSHNHIEGCLILFDRYAADYNMTDAQRQTALVAWLCQTCVDSADPSLWDKLGDDVMTILAFLERDENYFPRLSDAGQDAALGLNVGLQAWVTLSSTADQYKAAGSALYSLYNDHDIDRHYAFTVLNDRPALETALTVDCRAKAKQVIDTLRGRAPGHHIRPV